MHLINKRRLGNIGEEIAVDFLVKNNYKILTRNYRIGKLGEIDIIALENEYVCFIEVKTRTCKLYGMPSESVNRRKQERIIRLANVYLKQCKLNDKNARFDVLEIIIDCKITDNIYDDIKIKDINIIKNAF